MDSKAVQIAVPDLGRIAQARQAQEAAIKADILATAQQIYVKVVSKYLSNEWSKAEITPDQCRAWAKEAYRAAPYLWEAAGFIKLGEAECQQP